MTLAMRRTGAFIGRYRLIGRLAKGGMAEAFLALSGELPGLRTLVVVKRILPHLAANEQFVRMFLDEARIGALLDHPNIPRIIEVGPRRGRLLPRDGGGAGQDAVGDPAAGVAARAAARSGGRGVHRRRARPRRSDTRTRSPTPTAGR